MMIEDTWNFYQNSCLEQKKAREEGCSSSKKTQTCLNSSEEPKTEDDDCTCTTQGNGNDDDEALKLKILKLDMEEKGFHYIPPRTNPKRFDYIHYVRKKDDGALAYAAHADYYTLLRACADVAQVDVRIMHMAVLKFEKRLNWIEDKIEDTLRFIPEKISCDDCQRRESKTRKKRGKSKTRTKD